MAFRGKRKGEHRIFVSYRRRGDSAGYGGRIAEKMIEYFGNKQCFLDVEDIEAGVDFETTITEAVNTCDVIVIVIGPDWTTQTDDKGSQRLRDPQDFVRIEVSVALQRNIRIIPVLVGGAQMPNLEELPEVLEGLTRRQYHELTDTRWEYDIEKLCNSIQSIGIKGCSPAQRAATRQKRKMIVWIACSCIGVFLLMAAVLFYKFNEQKPPTIPTENGGYVRTEPAEIEEKINKPNVNIMDALERLYDQGNNDRFTHQTTMWYNLEGYLRHRVEEGTLPVSNIPVINMIIERNYPDLIDPGIKYTCVEWTQLLSRLR